MAQNPALLGEPALCEAPSLCHMWEPANTSLLPAAQPHLPRAWLGQEGAHLLLSAWRGEVFCTGV